MQFGPYQNRGYTVHGIRNVIIDGVLYLFMVLNEFYFNASRKRCFQRLNIMYGISKEYQITVNAFKKGKNEL